MADGILIGMSEKGPQTLALKRANRHGLIAGATGTGKTVTLQLMAESFAREGVAVFAADVKGDLSGVAAKGAPPPKWAAERAQEIGMTDYTPDAAPVVFWDLFGVQGHPVRTTVTEMGPLLLSRILDLSEAQDGALTIAFKLADDRLPDPSGLLLDMKDLRAVLNYVAEHEDEVGAKYGLVSSKTVAAIQRKLLQLELDGADNFFGEPALDIADMIRTDASGKGIINVLRADKLIQTPRLYATFLLWLLSELWEELPEAGDLDKPKIVFFFDEAHLLFKDAPKSLLDRIEQVARLIRSKGVGIYFVTQSPADIPDDVLGQLGNRVQHALRAYTPADQKALRAAASSFRADAEMDVPRTIQELGVGVALVSTLDAQGVPTPVAITKICPPRSRVGPLTEPERTALVDASTLKTKYHETVDRASAYEILGQHAAAAAEAEKAEEVAAAAAKQKEADRIAQEKLAAKTAKERDAALRTQEKEQARLAKEREAAARERATVSTTKTTTTRRASTSRTTPAERVGGRIASNVGNTIVRELMRGIFGNLGGRRRRR